MKNRKRILSIFLAFVVLLGVVVVPRSAFAQANGSEEKTLKVTLHKLLMSEEELEAWDSDSIQVSDTNINGYDGSQDLLGLNKILQGLGKNEVEEIPDVYFAWQRQFKLIVDEKEVTEWHFIDEFGNDLGKEISAENEGKILGGLTGANGKEFLTGNLPNDSYRIVEIKEKSNYVGSGNELLTGSKAVPVEITLPLVNKNGVLEEAHVYPKNSEDKPKVDKDFEGQAFTGTLDPENNDRKEETNGIMESHNIGDEVAFEIKTLVPANSEYKTAAWTDQMTEGLTFKEDSLVVNIGGVVGIKDTDYRLTIDGNGFVLELLDSGLDKINKKDGETLVHITYKAVLNELAQIEVPERNDVIFHYGNKPSHGNTPYPTKPSNGELTVTKKFVDENGEIDWVEGEKVVVKLIDAQTGEQIGEDVELTIDKQSHTFTGLDNDREYKVVENFIPGDEVTYVKGEDGQVIIQNKKVKNPNPINPEEPGVVTYGKKFVKADKDSGERLSGAKFLIKNEEGKYLALKDTIAQGAEIKDYESKEEEYQNAINRINELKAKEATDEGLSQDETSELENLNNNLPTLRDARDEAYKAMNLEWTYVDTIEEAFEFTSNEKGQFEVKGLVEGKYEVIETKAPIGYADANNRLVGSFNAEEGSYTREDGIEYEGEGSVNNTVGDALRLDNKKVTIPQTGGIGTLIFTVVGISVMVLALVIYRKNNKEDLA